MRKKELEQKVSFLLEENMRLRDRRAELAQKILDDKNPDWAKINRDLKNEVAKLKYENEQLKANIKPSDDNEDKKSSFPSREEADEAVNHFGFAGMYYMDVIRYLTYYVYALMKERNA